MTEEILLLGIDRKIFNKDSYKYIYIYIYTHTLTHVYIFVIQSLSHVQLSAKGHVHDLQHAIERVTGRKARGLQMEEIGCKCQTFLSLLSGRRKQTSYIFFLLYTNLKGGFS